MHAAQVPVVLFLLMLLGGCSLRVTPPCDPASPTSVFVIDRGYHSSLILPREDGSLVEYAYGEWGWFVLNQAEWYRAIVITFGAHEGALGRQSLPGPATLDSVKMQVAAEQIYEIRVAEERVAALLSVLDERFMKGLETNHGYNPEVGLDFAHDPDKYGIGRTCNTRVDDWLIALGCDTGGISLFSAFRVETPCE